MTKKDLVNQVSERTGFDALHVEKVINHTMNVTKETLAKGGTIYVRGFGSIGPKMRKAKIARNISKGTSVAVPSRKVPFFKPSKEFRDEVATGTVRNRF